MRWLRQLLNRIFGNPAPEGVDQQFWESSDLDDYLRKPFNPVKLRKIAAEAELNAC